MNAARNSFGLRAAIVLCGGHSHRMGIAKAWLPFGEETMLQRIVRLLRPLVDQIIVVAAHQQNLPELSAEVIVARDAEPDRGPLQGLLAGLMALPQDISAAFVTSCDVPLIVPAFVERMFDLAAGYDIAVPQDAEQPHPLAGVYRPEVIDAVRSLLAQDQRRMKALLELASTRWVDIAELRDIDPQLHSLRNVNSSADYFAALAQIGLVAIDEIQSRLAEHRSS